MAEPAVYLRTVNPGEQVPASPQKSVGASGITGRMYERMQPLHGVEHSGGGQEPAENPNQSADSPLECIFDPILPRLSNSRSNIWKLFAGGSRMIPVFLLGEDHDATLRLPLCRILERHGGVLHICGAHAAQYAIGPARFLLYETSRLDSIQAEQAILIFKSRQAVQNSTLSLSDGVISILETENEAAARMLLHTGTTALTCGLTARDTLTLSSISDTTPVVTIQRAITAFDGRTLEPCEKRIALHAPLSGYELLSVCAVLLLTGQDSENVLEL